MIVTPDTKIRDLIESHPYLKEWLMRYADEFEKLGNPVVYNTLGRVATVETAAKMADVGLETLLDDIRTRIAREEIAAQERAGSGRRLSDEERERRQDALKGLIRELHEGASVQDVKARFDELVRDVDAAEIAAMEQGLISEGMPVDEVQRLCDVHVTVFKESLDEARETAVPEGHPIDAYRRENEAAGRIVGDARCALEELAAGGPHAEDARARVASALEDLAQIAVHYRRKENQLFPLLERHGIEGPTKVMWSLDDDIVTLIRNSRSLVGTVDDATMAAAVVPLLTAVDDMIYKEEKILFPTALQVVSDEEWASMAAGDAQIGYAWVEGPAGEAGRVASMAAAPGEGEELLLPLTTGSLTLRQIDMMLGVLPFDLSFVDADDRVRFYSEGDRVFPRSPGVIGREVRNCHPPKSVGKVEEILTEFKAGTKDSAEFWIEMGGRFLHIRYFAMRDSDGAYAGCLEVVQDATHVRSLTGQRRIVDW